MESNAAIYRRGVVMPLDDKTESALRVNKVSDNDSLQYLPIASDCLFEELWSIGLFHAINQECESLLDDYEECMIEESHVFGIAKAIGQVANDCRHSQDAQLFLKRLQDLVSTATTMRRPLLFVL
jgi:hypothetical protein